MVQVSVIVTVLNEQATINSLLVALHRQSLKPLEVIAVDGGSTDSTWSQLQKAAVSWPSLKIYRLMGNRSQGRNLAVSRSRGTLLAFTDAGCVPDPDWLENLVGPFHRASVQVVSGYYRGQPGNIFEKCLIPYVLVMPDKAGKTEFFPSARSMALRRSAWVKSGGFDETLWHNEDYAFAHHLKRLGYTFTFAPQAVVSWAPRRTFLQATWMFARFAIGDIQAGILRSKVKLLAIRYLIFTYLLLLSFDRGNLFAPLVLIATSYLVWAVVKNYKYVRGPQAFFWLPILQITSDISVLFGTVVGLLYRAVT